MNTKLSENFTLLELTKSDAAIRHGITNLPDPKGVGNLMLLCENILEPVRKHFGKPVKITSGYRGPELNKIIGGSPTSWHSKACAADIEIEGIDNKVVAKWIYDNLNFTELILEFYEYGQPNSGWVHVAYVDGKFDKETLRAYKKNGKTVYESIKL